MIETYLIHFVDDCSLTDIVYVYSCLEALTDAGCMEEKIDAGLKWHTGCRI